MFFYCNPQKKREKQGKNKTDIHSHRKKVYDEENDVQVPSICVFFLRLSLINIRNLVSFPFLSLYLYDAFSPVSSRLIIILLQ